MGLFDYIKNLLFPQPKRMTYCPRCGQLGPWNGMQCKNCDLVTRRPVAGANASVSSTPPPVPAAHRQVPARTLNLEAAQFAPISSGDALAQAKASSTLRMNPWWGRLDTIPPATDERTLLIDRTLVAYGLFKPEELVEIHKIGDQMLEIKGDEALAVEQARAAVAASQEERKRIKQQKKAEAAERKRKHAEAVAQRRATDIIFLGRGVSRGLADRRANIEKLKENRLPLLASPADVAGALGVSIPRLRWLAFHSEASEISHYVRFSVPKKSGGLRELAAPHRDLAAAQHWIFQNILKGLPAHPAAHGFVRGRSIRTNANAHVGGHVLVNADLQDFFPSITLPRVRGALEQLGYSPAAATILALLCTECPRRRVEYAGRMFHVATGPRALPQGACTSPALSNLISRRLDARYAGISARLGWRYTRYADDLSFSATGEGDPAAKVGYLLARIRHIAGDEGFAVNAKKTRVLKQHAAMSVTGVVVNQKAGVRRRDRRRMRALLHNARRQGLDSQNRNGDPHFGATVRGRIAFVHMINPEQAKPLMQALQRLPGQAR